MVSAQMLAQTTDLFAWYNAVFVVLFGIGFFFTLLQLIGLSHGSEVGTGADGDVDADLDADIDVDADASLEVDAHIDADVDVDVDADMDFDAHADVHAPTDVAAEPVGLAEAFAQVFALGKVPLSISLMILCYTTGVAGWISNEALAPRLGSPAKFFPLSLLLGLTTAFLVLRFTGAILGRYFPTFATSAVRKQSLVGMTAQAVLPVNERFGQASLHDQYGTLHMVACRVRDGAPAIAKGTKVVLLKYLPDRDLYVVGKA